MKRRTALGLFSAAGAISLMRSREAFSQTADAAPTDTQNAVDIANRGLPELTITDVKVIQGRFGRDEHTCVKVYTSEPGLYGVGDGCNSQRAKTIKTYIEEYIAPFAIGRSVNDIEKLWNELWVGPYWRASVDHSNAIAALDGALWDILGKRTGKPVYDLWGGKVREGNRAFHQVRSGNDQDLRMQDIQDHIDKGFRHFRLRGSYFAEGHGWDERLRGNDGAFTAATVRQFQRVRDEFGWDIDVGIDVHSALTPAGAIVCAKAIEEFRPFFVEDLFAIEDMNWHEVLRSQTAIGVATGEQMVSNNEWIELVANRWIDYIRPHVSAMGGPSLVKKLLHCCEFFGVQSSLHGPSNVSPVGHAINAHLEICIPNFGIGEGEEFDDDLQAAYPGCPEMDGAVRKLNGRPGWGIDIDENFIANFPHDPNQVRMRTRYDTEGAPRNP